MNEDHLPFVYLSLCEIQDFVFRWLFQRHYPTGQQLDMVNQFLCAGVGVISVQHAGGDVSFLSSKNLWNNKDSVKRETDRERWKDSTDYSDWVMFGIRSPARGQEFIWKWSEAT